LCRHTLSGWLEVVSSQYASAESRLCVSQSVSQSASMWVLDGKRGRSEESADRCTQTDTTIHEDGGQNWEM
jgi:hypothetical protein